MLIVFESLLLTFKQIRISPTFIFRYLCIYSPYLQEHYVSADKAGASHVFRKPNIHNPKLPWKCFMAVYVNAQTVPKTHL